MPAETAPAPLKIDEVLRGEIGIPPENPHDVLERRRRIAMIREGALQREAFLVLEGVGALEGMKDIGKQLFLNDRSTTVETGYFFSKGGELSYWSVLRTATQQIFPHDNVQPDQGQSALFISKAVGVRLDLEGRMNIGPLRRVDRQATVDRKAETDWLWDFIGDDPRESVDHRIGLALQRAPLVSDHRTGTSVNDLQGTSDRVLHLRTLPLHERSGNIKPKKGLQITRK